MTAPRPIRIGVSSCLLGQKVRYDGGHKHDTFLTETFGPFVEWVPVCPEVEAGFGTPREAMRLVRAGDDVRLVTAKTNVDLTDRMEHYSRQRVNRLASQDLSGYVLKKDSPSCGMARVKIYDENSSPSRTGRGLFAAALLERFPDLPVEEEGRLSDPKLRENFIERVFAYWKLRELFTGRWTVGSLVRFHTAHKLTLMVHSPKAYTELGRLVARVRTADRKGVEQTYSRSFMAALSVVATPGRNANVLMHMAGYLKKQLDSDSRGELLAAIEDYRRGLLPLIVPITLLRHHVRVHGISYLAGQTYLDPHPKELMLRNRV